jgi:hypothetical protein
VLDGVREFFLLEKALERARNAAPPPLRAFPLEAAERRRRAAEDLVGEGSTLPALVLYRDALRLLAVARASSDDAEATGFAALSEQIAQLPEPRRKALQSALAALRDPDPMALDRRSAAELHALREDASDLFAALEGSRRQRTPTQLKIVRVLRLAGVVLTLVLAVRVAWSVLVVPPNVALHRPVVASSRWPDTPDPAGLTDGVRTQLGAHTNKEDEPQMTIDLGASYRVKTIKVYNRNDCCPDEILPLIVELGDPNDPTPFVAERTQHFDVWTIDVGGKTGSSVRLHTRRKGYLALAEVEVYGAR